MSKNFKISLLIGIILGGFIYLYFRNELKAGIEFVRIPFIEQSVISSPTKAVEVSPWAKIELKKIYTGLKQPVYLTESGDNTGRIFIVEKEGKIISSDNKGFTTFLDITDRVRSKESERGLLSVAFHPGFSKNGRYFVYYTDLNGDVVISEFNAQNQDEKILMKIKQPYSNHNGGQVAFGPDGYLYIGTGDGGAAGDPLNSGQDKFSLLGKILRIDVNSPEKYGIPKSNPFFNEAGEKEIWAYGLRNPWRFSFDKDTGDLYISDVGQNAWEEINFQPANSKGGENYGWRFLEGSNTFKIDKDVDISSLTMPVAEYSHDYGCSVTGGYVYRGKKFNNIEGTYFFGDFCSGIIWGLRKLNNKWEYAQLLKSNLLISSFGKDNEGNVYVIDFKTGDIFMIVAN